MSDLTYEPVYQGHVRSFFEGVASRANRQIAAYFGDKIPLYCVVEAPKSGGTWLSSMMADYLRCPKPGASVLPSACRAVMHSHWRYHKRLKRTIYLVRDGRDVLVSLYFYMLRAYRKSIDSASGNAKIDRRLKSAFGSDVEDLEATVDFGKFLKMEIEKPTVINKVNWAQHVREWYDPTSRSSILYLKYEDLLADPVGELRKAIEHVSPIPANDRLLRRSVDHFSMESITGRAPGNADNNAFVRKGISGDWRNHFTRELASVFARHAGDLLIQLGYERNHDWINNCPES